MYYVIGLGNPGEHYTNTRHNIGARALFFAQKHFHFSEWKKRGKSEDFFTEGIIDKIPVTFYISSAFMNESGKAVKKIISKKDASHLVLLHDDLDIPIGSVKVSFDRGAGGHKGVSSVIAELGTKTFTRIRVGIAKKEKDGTAKKFKNPKKVSSFVLAPFTKEEEGIISEILPLVSEKIKEVSLGAPRHS